MQEQILDQELFFKHVSLHVTWYKKYLDAFSKTEIVIFLLQWIESEKILLNTECSSGSLLLFPHGPLRIHRTCSLQISVDCSPPRYAQPLSQHPLQLAQCIVLVADSVRIKATNTAFASAVHPVLASRVHRCLRVFVRACV